MGRFICIIRSGLFNVLFYSWTLTISFVTLPVLILPLRYITWIPRLWCHVTMWLLRWCCGIRYQIRGLEHIPAGGAIIACKHQSAWETIMMYGIFPAPCYVLKRELIFYPIFGLHVLALKTVAVNRKAGAHALRKMIKDAKRACDIGRHLIIFPEGTRTSPGTTAQMHPGIIALYQAGFAPVVPAALNSGLYWGRNSFLKAPGTIILEFLPPLPKDLNKREVLPLLQATIEGSCAKLSIQ
jgi:1-acyl-sn-glycerol-3-phosphate acyltransferase